MYIYLLKVTITFEKNFRLSIKWALDGCDTQHIIGFVSQPNVSERRARVLRLAWEYRKESTRRVVRKIWYQVCISHFILLCTFLTSDGEFTRAIWGGVGALPFMSKTSMFSEQAILAIWTIAQGWWPQNTLQFPFANVSASGVSNTSNTWNR